MEKTFWDAVKNRRSIYAIGNEKIVSEEKIQEYSVKILIFESNFQFFTYLKLLFLFWKNI